MKMYILIRESVPTGHAMLAAAHASLACYLKFRDTPEVTEWLSGPFYMAVCKVSDNEFQKAKEVEDHVMITESAVAFKPRQEWPNSFKFFRLYR